MINPFSRQIILLGNREIADAIEFIYPDLNCVKKTESIMEAVIMVRDNTNNLILCCETEPEYLFRKLEQEGFHIGCEFIGIRRLIDWLDIYRCINLSKQIRNKIQKKGLVCWGDELETNEFLYVNRLETVNRIPVDNKSEVLLSDSFIVITSWEYKDMIMFLKENSKVEGRDFIFYKQLRDKYLASKMFWEMIKDSKKYQFICDAPFDYSQIESGGNVRLCCLGLKVNSGNLNDLSFKGTWNSAKSRIIRLSVLTGKYTFCDNMNCPYLEFPTPMNYGGISKAMTEQEYPQMVNLSTDHTCNLFCDHCRNQVMVADEDEQCNIEQINDIVISELLPHIQRILLAGNGEVFFSKSYRKILENESLGSSNLELAILSNGLLFNEENFSRIKIKRKSIGVSISIDACTEQTYKKVRRGGNFSKLCENLKYISALRTKGDIVHFQLNFVVRADNVHEMGDFVDFAKKLNVDTVRFSKLENWIFSEEEFAKRDIFVGGAISEKYRPFLRDCRLLDPRVDLRNIRKYM